MSPAVVEQSELGWGRWTAVEEMVMMTVQQVEAQLMECEREEGWYRRRERRRWKVREVAV